MNYSEKHLLEGKAHRKSPVMETATMRRVYSHKKRQSRRLLSPLGQSLIVLGQWLADQPEAPAHLQTVQANNK
mgnify:CR=1 FL=1